MVQSRDSTFLLEVFGMLLAAINLLACTSPKPVRGVVFAKEPASSWQDVALVGSSSSEIHGLRSQIGQGDKLHADFVLVSPYDGSLIAVTPSTPSKSGCAEEYRDGDPPQKEQISVETGVSEDAKTVTIESSSQTTDWRHLFAEVSMSEANAPAIGKLKAEYRIGGDTRWYSAVRPVVAIWQPANEFLQRTSALLGAAEDSIREMEERSGNAN